MAYTFDGPNKRIILSSTTTLDLRDLWSRWQEWINTGTNSRFAFAMDATGGNPIDVSLGTYIPCYIFLINGWKVRPMESNHTLNVTNGIIVDATGDPFVDTLGTYRVNVRYQQPVQAISFDAGGGGSGGGLTTEQAEKLTRIDTNVTTNLDKKVSEVTGGGGGIVDFTKKNEQVLEEFKTFKDLLKKNEPTQIDYEKIKKIITSIKIPEPTIDISGVVKGVNTNIGTITSKLTVIEEKLGKKSDIEVILKNKEDELLSLRKENEEKCEKIEELEEEIENYTEICEVLEEESEDLVEILSDTH